MPRPTDAEMTVLRVLWRRGPSTVREVLGVFNETRPEPFAYTTVLRFLQIMHEKGLVVRDDAQRGHVLAATVPAERTKGQMVKDLLDRAFGGSVPELVPQALGAQGVPGGTARDPQTAQRVGFLQVDPLVSHAPLLPGTWFFPLATQIGRAQLHPLQQGVVVDGFTPEAKAAEHGMVRHPLASGV